MTSDDVRLIILVMIGVVSALSLFYAYKASVKAVLGNKEFIEKLDSIKSTAEATHMLSNSAMGAQLAINVELLEALSVHAHAFADMTKQQSSYMAAQEYDKRIIAAKKLYDSHVARQSELDRLNFKA